MIIWSVVLKLMDAPKQEREERVVRVGNRHLHCVALEVGVAPAARGAPRYRGGCERRRNEAGDRDDQVARVEAGRHASDLPLDRGVHGGPLRSGEGAAVLGAFSCGVDDNHPGVQHEAKVDEPDRTRTKTGRTRANSTSDWPRFCGSGRAQDRWTRGGIGLRLVVSSRLGLPPSNPCLGGASYYREPCKGPCRSWYFRGKLVPRRTAWVWCEAQGGGPVTKRGAGAAQPDRCHSD